jgi:nucleobase:cation symporter-1, NCS1 family
MAASIFSRRAGTAVETTGLEHITVADRHGHPRNLFSVWFSTNLTLGAFVTGALSVQLGLTLWQAAVALVAGVVLGAVLIPTMSYLGFRLGIPQMLMARPAFGYVGAALPATVAWLNFLGWFTVLDVLGAQALQAGLRLPIPVGLVLLSAVTVLVAVVGHDLVHLAERWLALAVGAVFVVLACLAAGKVHWNYAGDPSIHGAARWGIFGLVVAISYSYAGPGYTPYASDYTRYLPLRTRFGSIFVPSFAGMAISTSLVFLLGAAMTTIDPKSDPTSLIGVVTGGFKIPAMLALALGTVAANVMNVYSGGLTALLSGIRVRRWVSAVVIGLAGTVLALWMRTNFIDKYENYLLLILYLIPAMDAIFLVDFYVARRGRYEITDFYDRRGRFGAVNPRGWISYLVGVAVCVPLMSSALYTGPIAKYLDGADLSYIVSMLVAGGLYYLLSRVSVLGTAPIAANPYRFQPD